MADAFPDLDVAARAPVPLAALADPVGADFGRAGALGVVLVDARSLDVLEHRYGADARERALAVVAEVMASACEAVLQERIPLARGDNGRGELLALVPHLREDGSTLARDLPVLERMIGERLAHQGPRIVHPYLRKLPPIGVGSVCVLRNPLLSERTQLREAIESARADAELNQRLASRTRRRGLVDILMHGQVHSVYEPIVDAHALTVFGYEALVRGPDDTPFASPVVLFEVAAEADLLFELDCLCRQAALEGAEDFPDGAKLFLNIRPSSFHDPSFQPDALSRTLARCRLAPSDIVFEISEQESIENYEILREARDAYGKLGFQFALDDTGAGYASLEAVAELGPEFIKVDRAFVRGIDEDPVRQNILRALQSLARDLDARIIGEGLDTLEELRTLGALGIPFGQGWLFGKPSALRADS